MRPNLVHVPAAAAVALLAMLPLGCSYTASELLAKDPRPGLADVTPIGPAGQKCFDFCGQSQAECKHMCPGGTAGECQLDCEIDTKGCLADCPELRRPVVRDN